MTPFVEAILPDESLGIDRIVRTKDAHCAFCGENLPPRHWVLDLHVHARRRFLWRRRAAVGAGAAGGVRA